MTISEDVQRWQEAKEKALPHRTGEEIETRRRKLQRVLDTAESRLIGNNDPDGSLRALFREEYERVKDSVVPLKRRSPTKPGSGSGSSKRK
jgi:hypothetical protein